MAFASGSECFRGNAKNKGNSTYSESLRGTFRRVAGSCLAINQEGQFPPRGCQGGLACRMDRKPTWVKYAALPAMSTWLAENLSAACPFQDAHDLDRVPRLFAPGSLPLGVQFIRDGLQGHPFGPHFSHERLQVSVGFSGVFATGLC
jgi:hypothetical protein